MRILRKISVNQMFASLLSTATILYSYVWVRYLHAGRTHFFNDYYSYYLGGKLFWAHQNIYDLVLFKKTAAQLHLVFGYGTGYSYPPLLAALMFPFTTLTFNISVEIWTIINLFLYCTLAFLIIHHYRKMSLIKLVILAILIGAFAPLSKTILNGQVNIYISILMYFYLYGKENLQAISLAIMSFIKVYPVFLVVPKLLYGKVSLVKKFLCVIGLILFLLTLLSSFSLVFNYFINVLPQLNNRFDTYYTNQSINGFVSRFFNVFFHNNAVQLSFYSNLILSCSAIAMAAILTIFRKGKTEEVSLLWIAVVTLIAGHNSFWNFAPCIFIEAYILSRFSKLSFFMKVVFIVSVFIASYHGHLIGDISYKTNIHIETSTFIQRFNYTVAHSIGFFYLVLQSIPLIYLIMIKSSSEKHTAKTASSEAS